MQVIARDKAGNPIAIERGLFASTLYVGHRRGSGLSDVGEGYDIGAGVLNSLQSGGGGGFDWSELFSFINNNPIVKGFGQKVSGQPAYPLYPYGSVPGTPVIGGSVFGSGSINPMYLLLGAGALVLVLAMKR